MDFLPEGVRLAVSPLSWTNDVLADLGGDTPVETCLNEAASAGYQGVELGRLFPRDAAALRPMLDARGLSLASGWYSGELAVRDAVTEREAARDHASLLAAMGCKVMVYGEVAMMAGDAPLDAPMSQRLRMGDSAGYAARLTDFAGWLMGEYGLTLAYHHHLMMVAEEFDEIAAIFDAAGRELGLLLDTGHAAAAGFDYARLIDRFGDRIVHIHLKDMRADVMAQVRADDASFNAGVRAGMFTVPGDGAVDFAPIARFVRGSGYQGWLVIEAEQDPALTRRDPRHDPYRGPISRPEQGDAMTKRLNIGLIGSGFMGQAHADAFRRAGMLYRDLPAVPHLYMIADATPELAADAASRFGFEKSTGDWRELVKDPGVDVVDITSPNAMHHEMALAAIAAGKHVYCEKPLSVTVAEAEEMTAAARAKGVKTMVAFNNVKTPAAMLARQIIDAGEIGTPIRFRG
ncbi:myo-inosose-2 dehydratase [Paracoccus xiamenensis]|uniref:myo-inosose-2 dehydratase n=1 Tax=Paracoccus xiamenensis TaxID=2714901 RepID=UPI001A98D359|nr:myo-inosose-2 dehydratase [Paracoccus xiamenensis]